MRATLASMTPGSSNGAGLQSGVAAQKRQRISGRSVLRFWPLLAVVYTLFVIVICVVDALTISSPPRSNFRYHDGAAQVFAVAPGDVLDRAGVQPGDRVVAFDGEPLLSGTDLLDPFRQIPPGTEILFTVRRGEELLQLRTTTWRNARPLDAAAVLVPVTVLMVLGVGVFLARPDIPASTLLLLYCLAAAINDAVQLTSVAGTHWPQMVMTFAYTLTSLPAPAVLLHLLLVFPDKGKLQQRLMPCAAVAYLAALALGLDYFLPTVIPEWRGVLAAPELHTVLIRLYGSTVVGAYVVGAISLLGVVRTAGGERVRNQARVLLGGLLVLLILQLGLWEIPLRLTGRPLLGAAGYCLLDLVVPSAVALAIIGFRLFDIDVLVRQGLVYAAASAVVAGVFVGGIGLVGWFSDLIWEGTPAIALAVTAAVAALLFHPVRLHAQQLVDRAFYRKRYDFREALTEIGNRVGTVLDLSEAVAMLHARLDDALKPEWIEIAVRRSSGRGFELYSSGGLRCGGRDGDTGERLRELLTGRVRPFRLAEDSLPDGRQPAVVVPLVRRGELLGGLLLGRRMADVPYVREDLDFLAALGGVAGAVIENGRLLEERSLRERLALLGSAASNMVHELKNPLGAMRSTLAVLRRRLRDDPRGAELADIVDREIDRLQDRVLDVLSFVRAGDLERRPLQLGELVDQLLVAVEHEFSLCGIEVEVRVAEDSPEVDGDADRIRQAVLNVLLNAREALSRGGRIRLLVQPWSDSNGVVRGVELVVADDGPGFEVDVLERATEPFVTTKALGSGLGLANVKRIVDDHGGQLVISNSPEGGARVKLRLPGHERSGLRAARGMDGAEGPRPVGG